MAKKKGKYVIVRTYSAGAFAGYLKSKSKCGTQAVLDESRRLWYWKGAASLSQLATDGVKFPNECKFPDAINGHELTGVIEVIPVTSVAQKIIQAVPIWKA